MYSKIEKIIMNNYLNCMKTRFAAQLLTLPTSVYTDTSVISSIITIENVRIVTSEWWASMH